MIDKQRHKNNKYYRKSYWNELPDHSLFFWTPFTRMQIIWTLFRYCFRMTISFFQTLFLFLPPKSCRKRTLLFSSEIKTGAFVVFLVLNGLPNLDLSIEENLEWLSSSYLKVKSLPYNHSATPLTHQKLFKCLLGRIYILSERSVTLRVSNAHIM